MTTKNLQIPVPERVSAELLLRRSTPAQSWQLADPNLMLRLTGMSPYRPTRREFLIGAGGLLVLAPFGCGSSGESEQEGTTSAGTRTIEHKYGATEISGTPERVVTVGLTDQDYVLAFGVAPVGTREWFGSFPGALWPWARENLGDEPLPEVLPMSELNFEQVAALEPDVVLGLNSGLTENEYGRLSEIAPTVAQPRGHADYGAPWQEITRKVARSLDREEEAEGLITPIEERFERARNEHPTFEDSTGLLAATIDGSTYVYSEGPAPGFLKSLGLELPSATADLFSDNEQGSVEISQERLDLLEADVLLLGLYGSEETSLVNEPLFQQLDVAQQGRYVLMPELSLANGAITFSSVLSLPIALEEMVPRLASAIDGDLATEVEAIPEINVPKKEPGSTS